MKLSRRRGALAFTRSAFLFCVVPLSCSSTSHVFSRSNNTNQSPDIYSGLSVSINAPRSDDLRPLILGSHISGFKTNLYPLRINDIQFFHTIFIYNLYNRLKLHRPASLSLSSSPYAIIAETAYKQLSRTFPTVLKFP